MYCGLFIIPHLRYQIMDASRTSFSYFTDNCLMHHGKYYVPVSDVNVTAKSLLSMKNTFNIPSPPSHQIFLHQVMLQWNGVMATYGCNFSIFRMGDTVERNREEGEKYSHSIIIQLLGIRQLNPSAPLLQLRTLCLRTFIKGNC